ncbi:MAG: hypothetical protein KatS3mg103_1063 [Phycisphaerales bacterium]|nr:MAG: hypothetical protein KatS3mg103_1063 [Phycisphaerales bacterium]
MLLNRAPTLHRMGIQAFEPVLVEGNAIRIHPLVCTGFNADFDGDQMAVHLPLSSRRRPRRHAADAQHHNIFRPANGPPIISPRQDIVLGVYFMHAEAPGQGGDGLPSFKDRRGDPRLSSRARCRLHARSWCAWTFDKVVTAGRPVETLTEHGRVDDHRRPRAVQRDPPPGMAFYNCALARRAAPG